MARALRVRLIKIKHDINAEAHHAELEKTQIEAQQAQLETKRLELEQQLSSLKSQIDRAHRYGVSHARKSLLTCVPCFVVHNTLQNMMPATSAIGGVNLYKCPSCGDEIYSEHLQ